MVQWYFINRNTAESIRHNSALVRSRQTGVVSQLVEDYARREGNNDSMKDPPFIPNYRKECFKLRNH